MPKDELMGDHVSLKQITKAVEALHSHELKKKEKFEENQILPAKEQFVWLNVTVKTVPVVHPLVDPRTTPVCLITKDPQREYKDLLESHNIKFISRVVGIEKLKGKFKPFEARRMLLKENGLFLADERVVPLLPKLLGSKWFEAKKQPIPVCLTRKDLKGELERAISSTYMNQNQGTYTSIKIGRLSQKASQIVDNIKAALPAILSVIKGGWANVQSFNIKTNSSVSLPIWSCALDDSESGRWHGLNAEEEESADGDEVNQAPVGPLKPSGAKQRRQSNPIDDDNKEQPRKKAKMDETVIISRNSNQTTDGHSKSRKTFTTASQDRKEPAPTTRPSATASPAFAIALPRPSASRVTSDTTKVTAKPEKKAKSSILAANGVSSQDKSLKSSLSTLILKQKRNSGTLEKKKQLIAKSKGGKSAKNAVLGKRVAQ